jgi:hypothetical protein
MTVVMNGGFRLHTAILIALTWVGFALFAFTPAAHAATTLAAPPAGAIANGAELHWAGVAEGTIGNAADCADPFATGACSSFFITPAQSGTLRIALQWPAAIDPILEADLDLYVYRCPVGLIPPVDPLDPVPLCEDLVAFAQTVAGNIEQLNVVVTATRTYEVRAVPAFVFEAQAYEGCAVYVIPMPDPCPDPVIGAASTLSAPVDDPVFLNANACGTDVTTGTAYRANSGGGYFTDRYGNRIAYFQTDVRESVTNSFKPEGKVQYSRGTYLRFASDGLSCSAYVDKLAVGTDGNQDGKTLIRGTGILTRTYSWGTTKQRSCFGAISDDNGTADGFQIEIYPRKSDGTCDTNNPVWTDAAGGGINGGYIRYSALK